ncbi:AFL087Cp [Eremothecium gossypii ATCC 10895]|uniref:AFL087Cp n=1 Tax=Eremothecium gossypii (strain ATCC 10895 / CBS 109.51 / FGSC 9923 / NRRL Y-1056) TaxID=284811 RepID=Q755B2_EREGS|nr:AFL087Cp [Eremothecium gossypii ATCC 10895]AAS53285.1 AFL087Cp [Eremothecium gossypii ATCC 10895]AEY97595.1 FAFL087Cp [Eremothecium gossypii FDAG1]
MEYSQDAWGKQSPLDASPSAWSVSETAGDVPSGASATTASGHNVEGSGARSSPYSEASYNNVLSDQAIERIRRQQNQNKLIHLEPIPDFKDKNDIKPWLQKIFYPQGIEIVIERSDKIKVVFKCKASKRTKSGSAPGSQAGAAEDELGGQYETLPLSPVVTASQLRKKKRAVSPYNTCPFRVRAAYSLKRKRWSIVVVNNGHSHPLKFNPDSAEYRKFKNNLRQECDWDAVKKFDELEYRSKFNLPTEPTPIPCDCGLTQEIESFNVILPSTNILGSSAPVFTEKKTVSKPRCRKTLQRDRCSQLRRQSTQSKLTHELHTALSPTLGSSADTLGSPVRYAAQDAEVDFTEVFLRSLPPAKPLHSARAPDAARDSWHALEQLLDDPADAPPRTPLPSASADCVNPLLHFAQRPADDPVDSLAYELNALSAMDSPFARPAPDAQFLWEDPKYFP